MFLICCLGEPLLSVRLFGTEISTESTRDCPTRVYTSTLPRSSYSLNLCIRSTNCLPGPFRAARAALSLSLVSGRRSANLRRRFHRFNRWEAKRTE
jgi:hypothetical protein